MIKQSVGLRAVLVLLALLQVRRLCLRQLLSEAPGTVCEAMAE